MDVEADCTHDGNRHKVCTECGEILETEVIDASGHVYGETQTKAATCEEAGYTYHVCETCGHEEKLGDIPAKGHTPGEWIVETEATEETEGVRYIICTECGEELLREEIPPIPEAGVSTGMTVAIAVGSSVCVGGCSGLIVWLILRKKKRI